MLVRFGFTKLNDTHLPKKHRCDIRFLFSSSCFVELFLGTGGFFGAPTAFLSEAEKRYEKWCVPSRKITVDFPKGKKGQQNGGLDLRCLLT